MTQFTKVKRRSLIVLAFVLIIESLMAVAYLTLSYGSNEEMKRMGFFEYMLDFNVKFSIAMFWIALAVIAFTCIAIIGKKLMDKW